MQVRRPIASFYPLSLFYSYINFVGSLNRKEIMHWCKIITHRIQSISITVSNEMLICVVAIQVFGKGFPLHQVALDWGG
jgi:hypothetical protein